MIPDPVRMFRPQGPERVAVVSAEQARAGGQYLVRLGRGARFARLTGGGTFGPFAEDDVADAMAQLVDQLRGEGFLRSGLHALFADLRSNDSAVRGRAALRLGWRRDPEAIDPLLAALPNAVDDVCPILDALGWLGDTKAIPVLREYAGRKLLSRRRSAVEALRNLDDEEGLAEARERAIALLPSTVRPVVDAEDDLLPIVERFDPNPLGLVLDTLYELGSPAHVRLVRRVLGKINFGQPHLWRYVKSIFKRSLLRFDFQTFGLIAHAVEAQGRQTTGTTATVKSGYDGVERSTSIFRQKTQHYVRRLAWRFLRRLAFHRPDQYPFAAAEAIIPYVPQDAEPARGLYGPYASCYVLNRVIHGGSQRFHLDDRRLLFRFANMRATQPPTNVREEAYVELWDAEPRAYLRVLGAAQLADAHVFAVRALSVQRMKEAVLMTADNAEIIALLRAPYEPTVELGLEELDRRFDPQRPDWELVALVLADERRIAQERARRWVRDTATLWTRDPERILTFLSVAHPELRSLVVELAADELRQIPDVRKLLALKLLQLLRAKEAQPGAHEAPAMLARLVLLAELDAVLSIDDIMALIGSASPSAQAVGGDLLARRPAALEELGLERLTALAQHEIAAVRAAAHVLLRGGVAYLRADPSALFVLVESDWEDTRVQAFELLRNDIGYEALGLDGIIGLVDSNRADVQEVGRALVRKHFASLPSLEVIGRLVQHPAPSMRPFTVDLVLHHLGPGVAALAQVQDFCKAALFELWPDRHVKRGVIDLLGARGLQDAEQAGIAAKVLSEMVRVKGRADFERALEALVRIKLAFPEVEASIRVL